MVYIGVSYWSKHKVINIIYPPKKLLSEIEICLNQ